MKHTLRNILMASAVAVIALASTSAMAESKITVPFNFKVNGKSCPAGDYVLQQNLLHTMVTLTSRDGSRRYTWLLQPGDPAPTATEITMRFDEQGQEDFLRTIQMGSQVTPRLDKGTDRLEHSTLRTIMGR